MTHLNQNDLSQFVYGDDDDGDDDVADDNGVFGIWGKVNKYKY